MKKQCEENLGTWKHLSEERKKAKEKAEQEKAAAENQEEQDVPDNTSQKDEVKYE